MEPHTHLAHLSSDIDQILATPSGVLDQPVSACPGWSVGDLLGHLAGVYRFCIAQLRAEPGAAMVPFDPPPEGPPLDVLRMVAEELLTTLASTDADEHRPNWSDAPTAAFWFRRMAQETAVHRVDVQLALGEAEAIDPALAVDGVDEFVDTFLRDAGRRGITGTGETVHLHATDPGIADGAVEGGEWTLTFTPEGVAVQHAHGKGDMAARGSASDLLLFVWNRRPVELETFGEPDLLVWWPGRVTI